MTRHADPPRFEMVGRDFTGPLVTGRPRSVLPVRLLSLPALLLVGVVLAVPVVVTLLRGLGIGGGSGGLGRLLDDEAACRAVGNSLLWVVVAALLVAAALGLAVLTRRWRVNSWLLMAVLCLPVAVAPLVAGVAFRLVFDSSPQRGTVSAVVAAAHDLLVPSPPLSDARPSPDGEFRLVRDVERGAIVSAAPVLPGGQPLELRLVTGESTSANPADRGEPSALEARAEHIVGRVWADGRPVGDVPVLLRHASGPEQGEIALRATTDSGGVFVFDLRDRSPGTPYEVELPAELVGPAWSPPEWLGPGWVWPVLVLAFSWTWLGFLVVAFRAGLESVPPELVLMARAEGVSWIRQVRTVWWPHLRPVAAAALLIVMVAALRLFDLLLVGVPGSVQDDVGTASVYWWRSRDTPGEADTLAALLFLATALVALLGLRGLRQRRGRLVLDVPWSRSASADEDEQGRPRRAGGVLPVLQVFLTALRRRVPDRRGELVRRSFRGWFGVARADLAGELRRWARRGAGVLVVLLWFFPLLVLVMTALRTPEDAARTGWWRMFRDGIGAESFRQAGESGLGTALWSTTVLAGSATVLVLVLAVPAAYLLAWGNLSRRTHRVLVVLLTLLAVAPAQVYAGPLGEVVDGAGLAGRRAPLILVYAAVGLPFAILLLGNVFATAPPAWAGRVLFAEIPWWRAVLRVCRRRWWALLLVAVLEFVQVWNDFVIGFLVSGPGVTPLTQVLWGQARYFVTSAGPVAAGAVVLTVVPMVVAVTVLVLALRWSRGGGTDRRGAVTRDGG